MKNSRLLLLVLLMITGLLLAACSGGVTTETAEAAVAQPTKAAATAVADTSGGNIAVVGGEFALDPANAAGAVTEYLYEGLIRIQDGAPVGALAESFTVSEDGLDYIVNLRPAVNFHDGSVLNADLVVANFNRWFDPSYANRGSGEFAAWAENFGGFKGETTEDGKPKSQFDGIEKVDNFTVLIHLNTPDSDFITKLANPAFSIVSSNAFAGGDGGSGPYKFSAGTDSSLTLEPFAGYWDSAAIPTENMDVPLK